MLIKAVTMMRPHSGINKICTMVGKYKDKTFVIEQFYHGEKQVERHMEVQCPQGARHAVKIRQQDGSFKTWG